MLTNCRSEAGKSAPHSVLLESGALPRPGIGIDLAVLLKANGFEIDLRAKLHTGSYACIFQRSYAEALGIQLQEGTPPRFRTATGSFATFGHEVGMTVCGLSSPTFVYFAEDVNFERNVLGRAGWLNRLRIAIVDHDCDLYVSSYDET